MSELEQRRYDLDWLRIGAFLLLIFYHVGMYYVTWDWHVKSAYATRELEPLMFLTSPWRMSLLFLISGVATSYLLERRGAVGFLRRRSVRLLVPLVFAMLAIVPPQPYLEVVEKVQYAGSYADFLALYLTAYQGFCRDGSCLILPTWNHLWFVAYLWAYTLAIYVLVRIAPRAVPRLRESLEQWPALMWLLVPIAYLIAARMLLAARYPSTHALVDDWYNHAVYAAVFALGFVLAGTRAPWALLERARWHALGLVVLGWVFLCLYHGLYADVAAPHLIRRLWQAVFGAQQWFAIVAALGFARRHLNRDGAARRYLTEAVFPVYILHQTYIVVLAHALQPVRLAPLLEGVLLVATTIALCFLSYEGIRRVAVLRPLFGLAPRSSSPALAPLASSAG